MSNIVKSMWSSTPLDLKEGNDLKCVDKRHFLKSYHLFCMRGAIIALSNFTFPFIFLFHPSVKLVLGIQSNIKVKKSTKWALPKTFFHFENQTQEFEFVISYETFSLWWCDSWIFNQKSENDNGKWISVVLIMSTMYPNSHTSKHQHAPGKHYWKIKKEL